MELPLSLRPRPCMFAFIGLILPFFESSPYWAVISSRVFLILHAAPKSGDSKAKPQSVRWNDCEPRPQSMSKINVAIVGLGFGAEFIPIYQRHPNANMYAICQRTQKKLDAIGDAFGVETRYSDFNKLLKDPKVD